MRCFHICCLTILIYTPFILSSELEDEFFEDIPHHRGKRAADPNLVEAVRRIIRNGMSSFGLPPLDPLYTDQLVIPLPEVPGVVICKVLQLDYVNITGLSDFIANDLSVAILQLSLNFDLTFDVHAHADYAEFDFLVGDMIPLYGNGTLDLDVDDLRLKGSIKIGTNSSVLENGTTQTWVIVQSINVDIAIGTTTFNISNIMYLGGTQFAKTFNRIMSETTPKILNMSLESMKQDLIESVVTLLNEQLNVAKIALVQITACVFGSSNCILNSLS